MGPEKTFWARFASRFREVTIEPAVILFTIALNALGVTVQSYYVQTICLHNFQDSGNATAICSKLLGSDAERLIQQQAGDLASWRVILEAGPPILFGLIWGQLNDNFGSKFLLLIPVCGFMTSSLLLLASTQISGLHPALLLLASVPSGCTGGAVALTISALKYIVSMSNLNNRTFRLAMVELAVQVGQPIGTLLGAQITKHGGYTSLFLFTSTLKAVSMLYLLIFVKNNPPEKTESILQIKTCRTAVTVLIKKRPNRKLLLILVGAICLRVFSMNSIWTVAFLYTRLAFAWDLGDFSMYITVDGIVTTFGVMVASFIGMKLLKLSNTALGIPILLNQVLGTLVWTFSSVSWHMYLGVMIQFAQGIISVLIRSILSIIVPQSEIGKVFSFVTIMESVFPIISGTLHLKIYVATLATFPAAVFALNVFYNTAILLIFIWIRWSGKGELEAVTATDLTETPNQNAVEIGQEQTVNGHIQHLPPDEEDLEECNGIGRVVIQRQSSTESVEENSTDL